MNETPALPDAEARIAAETTFDRNVVVLAGAGTGKTTLLVNRLVHALLREPDPIQLREMVALTFTNKAANEMKSRLRNRLNRLLEDDEGSMQGLGQLRLAELSERYHVSVEHQEEKIQVALNDLEKSHIQTFHSFAAHILRLYPLESGVDPSFQEDEGSHFSEIFDEIWNLWLDQELGSEGSQREQWYEVLDVMDLKEIREMTKSLCGDVVSFRELRDQLDLGCLPPEFESWLENKKQHVSSLLKQYSQPKPLKIERMLMAAAQVYDVVGSAVWSGQFEQFDEEKTILDAPIGKAPKGWKEEDFLVARRVIQSAHRLSQVNEPFLRQILQMLAPCVERVQEVYVEKGWIRFDGLLIRVRDLLRNHPKVREQLKTDFLAIMVDEFQDTDPLQYEILLYLGERPGDECRKWHDIRLVPGKLFIVGDPKQSIYAFRRADIEAFDQVVQKVKGEGGIVFPLITNFRSDQTILEVVNAMFNRLFVPQSDVQPPHMPLAVGRVSQEEFSTPGVEISVMANLQEDGEWNTERATRVEAEWLAAWIHDQLRPGKQWISENGVRVALRPGHIAVLFRKFTNAQVYLEAMHRQGIPYLTDGAKHFYRRQEVIDLVNVLRVLDHPHDGIALVGILRSSLGGVPDQEIMELARLGRLDIRRSNRLKEWDSARRPAIQALFERLTALHFQVNLVPLSELIDQIFSQLPIVELAAASSHGEQAMVNLWKLRDLMTTQAMVPHASFSVWVERLVNCLMIVPAESEGPLAEETLDAVRVLTIHKSKGLEFPVVVLPGLHQKSAVANRNTGVTFDWISGLYGCTLPTVWNSGQVPLWEKQRIREEAERQRVLYVGMTRARDRLVLSGGLLKQQGEESLLGLLQHIAEGEFGNPNHPFLKFETVSIPQTVVTPRVLNPSRSFPQSPVVGGPNGERAIPSKWMERESVWRSINHATAFENPSSLHSVVGSQRVGPGRPSSAWASPRLGTLIHRLLEGWDFESDPTSFPKYLAGFSRQHHAEFFDEENEVLCREIEAIMDGFLRSPPYREIQKAKIIGREVPFSFPWSSKGLGHPFPNSCVMEGVVDLVYEIEGVVWVGDYKTDNISFSTLGQRAEAYRNQAHIYAMAVSRSLGLEVKGCKLFFLRINEVVIVPYEAQALLH